MGKITILLRNEHGLHARPAGNLVKEAARFKSSIKIIKDGVEKEAKSIFNILFLAAKKGDTLTIVAEGSDEKDAIEVLKKLAEKNFGE